MKIEMFVINPLRCFKCQCKQIVKVPRPASGVVKRDMTGKVVKKSRNAKIVKEKFCK
jgi:hypothetical protein